MLLPLRRVRFREAKVRFDPVYNATIADGGEDAHHLRNAQDLKAVPEHLPAVRRFRVWPSRRFLRSHGRPDNGENTTTERMM